jgi:hypothetical protein
MNGMTTSGWCANWAPLHERCAGVYGSHVCKCTCHDKEPDAPANPE